MATNQQIDLELKDICYSYQIIKRLGQGAFGIVYLAQIKYSQGQNVALKCIDKNKLIHAQRHPELKKYKQQLIESEEKIMKQCSFEHLIKCHQVLQSKRWKVFVLEYCESSIYCLIEKQQTLDQQTAKQYLLQIIRGFAYLHQRKIIHRDLKTQNILIHQGIIKIADFGLSKKLQNVSDSGRQTILGSRITMAPQVRQGKPYGIQADLWSLGVVFYQMLTGYLPFFTFQLNQQSIVRLNQKINDIKISEESKDFLRKVLVLNPKQRLQWIQVYKMVNNNKGLFKLQKKQDSKIETGVILDENVNDIQCIDRVKFQGNKKDVQQRQVEFLILKNTNKIIKLYENTSRKITKRSLLIQNINSQKFESNIHKFYVLINIQLIKIVHALPKETDLRHKKRIKILNNKTMLQFAEIAEKLFHIKTIYLRQYYSQCINEQTIKYIEQLIPFWLAQPFDLKQGDQIQKRMCNNLQSQNLSRQILSVLINNNNIQEQVKRILSQIIHFMNNQYQNILKQSH